MFGNKTQHKSNNLFSIKIIKYKILKKYFQIIKYKTIVVSCVDGPVRYLIEILILTGFS